MNKKEPDLLLKKDKNTKMYDVIDLKHCGPADRGKSFQTLEDAISYCYSFKNIIFRQMCLLTIKTEKVAA
jgi:hypothetical protein